ncbi:hypothetical protein IGI04_026198, partial [Brassica rapa subsp. trilocularis]
GWQSRIWTADLARKSLLWGEIGPPFGKPTKLRVSRDGFKAGRVKSEMGTEREREGDSTCIAPVMVVSGSMMLMVSQVPSICTGGASSSHYKKFENSLSTEEEDLVPAMEYEVDGEEDKSSSFCCLLVIKMKNKKCD